MNRNLLCVAQGRDEAWEAICLDFDIAVSGRSHEEVRATLDQAIRTYIEDANAEAADVRNRLLARRAPWRVRAALGAKLAMNSMFAGRDGESQFEAHRLPCPA